MIDSIKQHQGLMEKTMNKKESIERMLVLANRLNAIVADLNAKKKRFYKQAIKSYKIALTLRS